MFEKKLHYLFIILLLLMAGCEKWNDEPRYETNGVLVKVENEEHKVIEKYNYNRGNKLESSWHKMFYSFDDSKAEYEYEFNSDGLLIKKDGYEPGNPVMSSMIGAMGKEVAYTYEYDSTKRVTKMLIEFDFGEYSDINYSINHSFEYPNDSTIIERINIINDLANSLTNCLEYQFNDKGNLHKKINYLEQNSPNDKILSIEEYQYDNKKSPSNINPIRHSTNNITEAKTITYNYDENDVQSVAYTSTFKYEYTYNPDGYPESRTETWPNDQLFIEYYFYKN